MKRADSAAAASVTLSTIALEDSILPVPLRFAPPYADLSTNPDGFAYNWQLLEYAFHLPKPIDFPAFKTPMSEEDIATARRYISTCRRAAGYSFINSSERMSVEEKDGSTTVETEFSSFESLSAFAIAFRQIHEQDEKASFRVVHNILSKYARTTEDPDNDERSDHLRHWRGAVGKLMGTMLKPYVARLVADAMSPTGVSKMPVPFENVRPLEVMSRWNYGDLIHWGEKRSDLEAALGRDEVFNALERMHVAESMAGLAHMYFGFSQVVEQAIRLQPENEPRP